MTTRAATRKRYKKGRAGLRKYRAVQRKASKAAAFSPEPEQEGAVGKRLPRHIRANAQITFGHDYGEVAVYPNSARASALQAQAFTAGNAIYFAAGHYNPGTAQGRALIGHELAHVYQQRCGMVQPRFRLNNTPMNANRGLEHQADQMATAFVNHKKAIKAGSTGAGTPNNLVAQAKFKITPYTSNQDKAAKSKFIDKMNKGVTMKVKPVADNFIEKENKSIAPTGTYEEAVHEAIEASQTVNFALTDASDYVFVDSFQTGTVDASDMLGLSELLFKSNVIHILAERFAVPDYEANKSTASKEAPHEAGLKAEEKFLKERYPDKDIKYLREGLSYASTRVDENGNGTTEYFFHFNDVKVYYVQPVKDNKVIQKILNSYIIVSN